MANPLRESTDNATRTLALSLPDMRNSMSRAIPNALNAGSATQGIIQDAQEHEMRMATEELRQADYAQRINAYNAELQTRAMRAQVHAAELGNEQARWQFEWDKKERGEISQHEQVKRQMERQTFGYLDKDTDKVYGLGPTGKPVELDPNSPAAHAIRRREEMDQLRIGEAQAGIESQRARGEAALVSGYARAAESEANIDYLGARAEAARRTPPSVMAQLGTAISKLTEMKSKLVGRSMKEQLGVIEVSDEDRKLKAEMAQEIDAALGAVRNAMAGFDPGSAAQISSGEPIELPPEMETQRNRYAQFLSESQGMSYEEAKQLVDKLLKQGNPQILDRIREM